MHRPFSFAETDEWRRAVLSSYPLNVKTVSIQDQNINLYGFGKEYANSPYITDGGSLQFKRPVKLNDLKDLKVPFLLKVRNKLQIDADLPHVLVMDYYTFLLDLQGGKEEVWKTKIKSKTRNLVRKSQKFPLDVRFGKLELLEDFYAVISRAWRDLGTPTHSKKFYENILRNLDETAEYDSALLVIYLEGKPVSGACLVWDSWSVHHPYSATLREANRYSVNTAQYWEIIKFAIDKNIRYFDMGRSRKGQSTIHPKLAWGAQPVQLYYYYFNKTKHRNDEDGFVIKMLINLWKKLPLGIANLLGPKIIYKVLK